MGLCFVISFDCVLSRHTRGEIERTLPLRRIKQVEGARWPQAEIGEITRPLRELHTVTPDTLVTEVLAVMGREDVNELLVVSHGRFEEIISRGHVVRRLQNVHRTQYVPESFGGRPAWTER